jgi:hypothetical protein
LCVGDKEMSRSPWKGIDSRGIHKPRKGLIQEV